MHQTVGVIDAVDPRTPVVLGGPAAAKLATAELADADAWVAGRPQGPEVITELANPAVTCGCSILELVTTPLERSTEKSCRPSLSHKTRARRGVSSRRLFRFCTFAQRLARFLFDF